MGVRESLEVKTLTFELAVHTIIFSLLPSPEWCRPIELLAPVGPTYHQLHRLLRTSKDKVSIHRQQLLQGARNIRPWSSLVRLLWSPPPPLPVKQQRNLLQLRFQHAGDLIGRLTSRGTYEARVQETTPTFELGQDSIECVKSGPVCLPVGPRLSLCCLVSVFLLYAAV